jgi:signal transduction histidine kinase
VLSNLLGNAVQHGHDGGTIDLSVRADGDEVEIAVRNDGTPIAQEALPTIFEPLVRGVAEEAKVRRRAGSIGLGLYIAREIVRAHGGTIGVTSSAAAGTVFTVRLPREIKIPSTSGRKPADHDDVRQQ